MAPFHHQAAAEAAEIFFADFWLPRFIVPLPLAVGAGCLVGRPSARPVCPGSLIRIGKVLGLLHCCGIEDKTARLGR